jgi:Na+-transporting NADH:ubiquinone oxidoreductase subunit NqrB
MFLTNFRLIFYYVCISSVSSVIIQAAVFWDLSLCGLVFIIIKLINVVNYNEVRRRYVIKQYISMTTYSASRKHNTDNTIMTPQQ